jgi:ribosomal 30S subunit maturation factor RimM
MALWPCGVLGRPHGLHGEISLEPLPGGAALLRQGAEFFLSKGGDQMPVPVRLERAGGADRRPILRLEGVHDRQAAAALSGAFLLASGGALEELPH